MPSSLWLLTSSQPRYSRVYLIVIVILIKNLCHFEKESYKSLLIIVNNNNNNNNNL